MEIVRIRGRIRGRKLDIAKQMAMEFWGRKGSVGAKEKRNLQSGKGDICLCKVITP